MLAPPLLAPHSPLTKSSRSSLLHYYCIHGCHAYARARDSCFAPPPSPTRVAKTRKRVTRAPSARGVPGPVAVIGHRGSPHAALENTSRSFLHAARAGADGVELDVFLLKCGSLVVFHGSGGDEKLGLLHSYCGVEGSM